MKTTTIRKTSGLAEELEKVFQIHKLLCIYSLKAKTANISINKWSIVIIWGFPD